MANEVIEFPTIWRKWGIKLTVPVRITLSMDEVQRLFAAIPKTLPLQLSDLLKRLPDERWY